MSMSTFLLGAASSFLASLGILAVSHVDDLKYLCTSRRRYRHLEGRWHQYHLTTDSRHRPATIWSAHDETLRVTSFGSVKGLSKSRSTPAFAYRVRGTIRSNVMRLRLINLSANELSASFTYPRLLSSDVLVGVWAGQDYDEVITAGPVVLSRKELGAETLAELVKDERLLSISEAGNAPPVTSSSAQTAGPRATPG